VRQRIYELLEDVLPASSFAKTKPDTAGSWLPRWPRSAFPDSKIWVPPIVWGVEKVHTAQKLFNMIGRKPDNAGNHPDMRRQGWGALTANSGNLIVLMSGAGSEIAS
jgi:hypothetical protein